MVASSPLTAPLSLEHTVALNLVYRNDNKKNRVETLAETHGPGEPVLSLGGEPAVTITGSGDYTKSEVIEGVGTLSGVPAGGVGLVGKQVTLAFDGTWEFPTADITGVTANTAQGTAVYITSAGALTNVASGNTRYGTVDYPVDYDRTRGFTPIKIGA